MRSATAWLLVPLIVGTMCPAAPVRAAGLCREAQTVLKADQEVARATEAALKVPSSLAESECLYPAKLMRYGSFDVLVTLAGAPGTLCHGCAATMSAYVLRRRPEGLAMLSRFAGFGEAGTFGDPGKIDPVSIAGSNGFAVQHGANFQGYSASLLDLYVFKSGKLLHLRPTLQLSASSAAAVADGKAIAVDASWSIGTGAAKEVSIDYKVSKGGRSSTSRATWAIEGTVLSLKSGRVPPEIAEAGGG